MLTPSKTEFLRYLFWYFAVVRAGGKKGLAPNFFRQATPLFLWELFQRRDDVVDLSDRESRPDSNRIARGSAFFTGGELWLESTFDNSVSKLFYESRPGPFVTQIHKVFSRFEWPAVMNRWEQAGEISLEDGVLPPEIRQATLGDLHNNAIEAFFGNRPPKLKWMGVLASAWSDGKVVIHRDSRDAILRMGNSNSERWHALGENSPILRLIEQERENSIHTRLRANRSDNITAKLKEVLGGDALTMQKWRTRYEPLFRNLQEIHRDYLDVFETINVRLRSLRDRIALSEASTAHGRQPRDIFRTRRSDAEISGPEPERVVHDQGRRGDDDLDLEHDVSIELRRIVDSLRIRRTALEPIRVAAQEAARSASLRRLVKVEALFIDAVMSYFGFDPPSYRGDSADRDGSDSSRIISASATLQDELENAYQGLRRGGTSDDLLERLHKRTAAILTQHRTAWRAVCWSFEGVRNAAEAVDST